MEAGKTLTVSPSYVIRTDKKENVCLEMIPKKPGETRKETC